MVELSRREFLFAAAAVRLAVGVGPRVRVFDVASYGAVGDGRTLDSPAIQRAIDEAAAYPGKAQVLVRGGKKYLVGTLLLKGAIDFHLADDAELLLSLRQQDYQGGFGAAIEADGARGLKISGTGTLQGRAREFMTGYDPANGWWLPKKWRPKMFVLRQCRDLEVRDITFAEAPNWGLHILGCDGVLVENVKVRNLLDVPNCDGIDPDHSRNVEIANCDIVCGDDAIVVKASRQPVDYGPSAHVKVRDCVIETQDAGLKIGTETTSDVHDVTFERCHIRKASRGLCIQLRDAGSVYNIRFDNITLQAQYFSDPWWGRGEAISLSAFPRRPGMKVGAMHHIRVQNVTARAENSVRVWGNPRSRPHDIVFDHVDLTLDRWTQYPGGVYDNRPTSAMAAIEPHKTVGFSLQDADQVTLRDCRLRWGTNTPQYFGQAVQATDCTGVKLERFDGEAAPPAKNEGIRH